MAERNKNAFNSGPQPSWYKDATLYELHVRAFYDSNGDGVGDFPGLAEKLDYLQDLGITGIWLLPFYPSPLKDDGYDISDYMNVHPAYGTLTDFRVFLREAHRRGLNVITELVMNHTSDQHPWFQRARRSPPGSSHRDYYVWSDTPEKYREARIIFKDFEPSNWTWDYVANAYYWHRFYSHQPDLNYENPEVRKAMFQVVDFWLGMGVDGLRLDAVPYLYEREGTNCENLPETHVLLKQLRRHVDEKFPNRMLLAEANQWPEDAVAYFGGGDECHMAFHFPVMPRMFMALQTEDRYPIIDILGQTPPIAESCQWALFLRNHDELTLEMVTDEERDYMYRMYAHDPQARINLGIRRRLAPLLGNDRRKIELMDGLLFSLPGTPILYYGDEIGMGDNVYLGDRNGVRTPMQWSADRNAGFSRANPQQLYLPVIIDPDNHFEVVNVEARRNNPNSLLWWIKRLIALRKRFRAFSRGTLEFLHPENPKVLAFVRQHADQTILVVTNLSRLAQYAELDLSRFYGMTPTELFGQTEFPPVGDKPYVLTLGPHAFYWFSLQPRRVPEVAVQAGAPEVEVPTLAFAGAWDSIFRKESKAALEQLLPGYLPRYRWFGGKARRIKSAEIAEAIPIPTAASPVYAAFVQVEYTEGEPETYVLILAHARGERAEQIEKEARHDILVRLAGPNSAGIIYGALREKSVHDSFLEAMARRRRFRGTSGEIIASHTRVMRSIRGPGSLRLDSSLFNAEQSNTSVVYADRFIMKLFRRLDIGSNPDLEIGLFLTEKTRFANIPLVAGSLEYRRPFGEPMTLAILQTFIPNQGDAWQFTHDNLGRYFERAITGTPEVREAMLPRRPLLDLVEGDIPAAAHDMIGPYLEAARLLGQRTAELHLALASERETPNFAPEPFSALYQRSVYQSMRNSAGQALQLLRRRINDLPESTREEARRVLEAEHEIFNRFRKLIGRAIPALRMRTHGDYHLGQVLYTGKDFVIIDFEGEPARPLSERRIKRSPVRDVAGMLRSFHYAAAVALFGQVAAGVIRPEDMAAMEIWARCWHTWVSSAFLRSYLKLASRDSFLPPGRDELEILLNAYLLEKATYELGYELNHRPDWVPIPLRGILELLEVSA